MLGEPNVVTARFADLNGREKLVLFPVVIIIILIGVHPDPLLHISESAVDNLVLLISDYSASIK